MAGAEPLTPHHHAILSGCRQEETMAGRGGEMGRVDDGVPSIWAVTGNIVALQIPRTPSHCDGRLLDSSHIKPPKGMEELGLSG